MLPTGLLQGHVRAGVLAFASALVLGSWSAASAAQAEPPPTVVRAADGGVTVHATRINEPIVVDGRLEEPSYRSVRAIDGFVQQEPLEGEAVSEQTEAWLFFDDRNLYVGARLADSHPERQVANEMRRDGQGSNDNETFAVVFDTFHDRRNGFLFQTALAGGLLDAYITDEREQNRDWNTVWDARTSRYEGGWMVEMAIPFKSLRFPAVREQVWGINFKRIVRWKNEQQYLTHIAAALGRRGINKLSSAATLVGIDHAPGGRNVEIKPYGIAGGTSLRPESGSASTTATYDAGFDAKIGLTGGLTSDISVNTDFAQVEEDEQQVNLTRFSVLFPEKREFFLEGQGIFSFGGIQNQPRGGGGGAGYNQGNPVPNDVPVLFFSRRIGLDNGREIPIDVGGRVTGKAGPYSVGLLDIRTRTVEESAVRPTNFGVVRLKRDILRRSAVGVIYTDRAALSSGEGSSRAYGVDGVFSFYQNVNINTYIARSDVGDDSDDRGRAGGDTSYRAQLDYTGDRYGLQLERLALGENFNPSVGFLRRTAFIRNSTYVRFSPRPARVRNVRKFVMEGFIDYITDPDGRLESRAAQGAFRAELQSGDIASIEVSANHESLSEPFEISKGVVIPVGGYSYPEVHLMYNFGPQRTTSGNVVLERGRFYGGTRTSLATGRGRMQITPRMILEPGLTVDWVSLPQGTFTNRLVTARTSYALTPRMGTSALVQYNSSASTFNTNVRFRWEYQPGSDLFVVYTDNRDTTPPGAPALRGRSFVVKLTRLFRL